MEIKPNYTEAHNNLGVFLASLGRVDEAITQYQKALQINPDFAGAHYNLGIALVGCGRFDEAIAQYQKALQIEPDDADAHNNLDIAHSQREGILKALAERRESLRPHPDDIILLNETAWVLATNPNASIRNGTQGPGTGRGTEITTIPYSPHELCKIPATLIK